MFRYDQGTGNERFSAFPQYSLKVGGINGPRLRSELYRDGIYIYYWAGGILASIQKPERLEQVSVVKFSLQDVGIRDYVSGASGWEKVVKAVQKEGLALCPQLTAPEMARLNADIIGDESANVLSKPIKALRGFRVVFALCRLGGGGPGLNSYWTDGGWGPGHVVIARLR